MIEGDHPGYIMVPLQPRKTANAIRKGDLYLRIISQAYNELHRHSKWSLFPCTLLDCTPCVIRLCYDMNSVFVDRCQSKPSMPDGKAMYIPDSNPFASAYHSATRAVFNPLFFNVTTVLNTNIKPSLQLHGVINSSFLRNE